jgi:hypothetical protein
MSFNINFYISAINLKVKYFNYTPAKIILELQPPELFVSKLYNHAWILYKQLKEEREVS